MIVELKITHRMEYDADFDDEGADRNIFRVETFLIDTDKVKAVLADPSVDFDYSRNEMEDLLSAIAFGKRNTLAEGGNKGSLIDTSWEADMVAPDDKNAEPVATFFRDVY